MKPLIITLCFAMLLSSTPMQLAAQRPTLNSASTRMKNAEFRKLILAKARDSNMTIRQRLQLRTGLAFFSEEIQEAVEVRLAYDGKGIGDGDIDWAKLFEQILEFIKLLLELFGTTDGNDGGVIIGDLNALHLEAIVTAEPVRPKIVMQTTVQTDTPPVVQRVQRVEQKPTVIPTVPMRQTRVVPPQVRRQSRVIYQRPMSRVQQNCLV